MSLGDQLGHASPISTAESRKSGDSQLGDRSSVSHPSASIDMPAAALQSDTDRAIASIKVSSDTSRTSASHDTPPGSAARTLSSVLSPLSVHANAYSPKAKAEQNGSAKHSQSDTASASLQGGSNEDSRGAPLPSLSVSSAERRSSHSPFNLGYSLSQQTSNETGDSSHLLTSPHPDLGFRRLSHSSTLAPNSTLSDGRPPFSRQSLSDGLSSAGGLGPDQQASFGLSTPSRQSSFSHGLPGQDFSSTGSPAPNTGPLSASDPRTQLIVSNLPYRVRWQDLKDLFRKAGTVLRTDVSLSADNRSRGYGTVLMANEQDAIKAVEMLGGFTWQSRTLDVRIDRSGSMGGVAGSAITPSLNPSAAPAAVNPMVLPLPAQLSQTHSNGSTSSLNIPALGGSQSQFSNSFGGSSPLLGTSPGTASPLSQAVHARPFAARNSIAGLYEGAISPRPPSSQTPRSTSSLLAQMGAGSPQSTSGLSGPGANTGSSSAIQSFLSVQGAPRRASDIGILPSPSQLSSWPSSNNQDQSLPQHQSTGGSSVPTGFPGATSMAPWPTGPGSFSNTGGPSLQSQPFGAQPVAPGVPTTSYAGRVLFVGNLPFHCQWQDLKDLFRAAGMIQRADVAIGPDGRSRGFGTVLFANQEDAQNAVRLYHGYEYSGRTLKVHFDRFATQQGPAVGTPGNPAQYTSAFAAAALPSHMTNNVRPPPFAPQNAGPPGMHMHAHSLPQPPHFQQQQQQQQQQFKPAAGPISLQLGQTSYMQAGPYQHQHQQQMQFQQQQQQQRFLQQRNQQHPSFAAANALPQSSFAGDPGQWANMSTDSQANRSGAYQRPFGLFSESTDSQESDTSQSADLRNTPMSIGLPSNGDFGDASTYLPSDLMSPGLVSPPPPPMQQEAARPGRIQLPSHGFAGDDRAGASADQMSPMTGRIRGLMTPGMPGFTFQQMPQTPPLHPHFLSPGLGTFSPNDGSDSFAANATSYPGFTNVAPGAPFQMSSMNAQGFSSMFGAGGGGQQQQQPATPHWSQPSGPARGSMLRSSGDSQHSHASDGGRGVGAGGDVARADIAKTPGAGPRSRPPPLGSSALAEGDAAASVGKTLLMRRASDSTPGPLPSATEEGYPFPLVAPSLMSHLTRRASTNSPASTPMLSGPTGSSQGTTSSNDRPGSSLINDEALASTSAEELAKTIARLSVRGTALTKDVDGRKHSFARSTSGSASSLAKLREHVPDEHPASDSVVDHSTSNGKFANSALGAPFGSSDKSPSAATTHSRLRLGLQSLPSPDTSLDSSHTDH